MSPSTSVLVIGCGGIGERHLRCFQKTGRASVIACDADAGRRERMAATYGVPVAADANAAIAGGDVTGVVICTPAHTHVPLARAALSAAFEREAALLALRAAARADDAAVAALLRAAASARD